jgi:hypothetical protein
MMAPAESEDVTEGGSSSHPPEQELEQESSVQSSEDNQAQKQATTIGQSLKVKFRNDMRGYDPCESPLKRAI